MHTTLATTLVVGASLAFSAVSCQNERTVKDAPTERSAESVASAPAPVAAPSASAGPATPTVPAVMKEHFDKSTTMEKALIRGNVDEFSKAAIWMAEHQLNGGLPVLWKSHLQGMQDAAREARDAKDLKAGALALGHMGTACAACHEQIKKPKITVGEPPAEGTGTTLHMQRHTWAAARMWEGLMAPDDSAWVKGCEVLSDAPLGEKEVAGEKSVSPKVVQLANLAHAVGHRGRTAKKELRGQLYGEFMETCVGCHKDLGVEMK